MFENLCTSWYKFHKHIRTFTSIFGQSYRKSYHKTSNGNETEMRTWNETEMKRNGDETEMRTWNETKMKRNGNETEMRTWKISLKEC